MDILIIDGDVGYCNKIKKFITSCGFFNITCSSDGISAKHLTSLNYYDLIFFDLHIPKINGMLLLKYVKKESMCKESKIVVYNPFPTVKTAIDSIKLGAIDYWTKPFKMERVKSILCQLC